VRKPGGELGTRCEIKNLNSMRFMQRAIEFEALRQIDILESGGTVDQETRLFDASRGETRSMRSKEEAHDYRYFPDPDLLPLRLEQSWIDRIGSGLPELPDAKKARFMAEFGLSAYDAGVLVAEQENAAFYEEVADGRDKKLAANWVISELFGQLNKAGKSVEESPVSAASMGGLLDLIADGTISGRTAKDVFTDMFETGKCANAIVEEKGLKQVSDTGAIEQTIDEVMAREAEKVADYRGGKEKLFGFFVGQVMKATGGKANPKVVNDLLRQKLDR
jgi:aspartyl-tRNA(Asn)/glutamyl-tRNA(Gln) amidotransferase subunit B